MLRTTLLTMLVSFGHSLQMLTASVRPRLIGRLRSFQPVMADAISAPKLDTINDASYEEVSRRSARA